MAKAVRTVLLSVAILLAGLLIVAQVWRANSFGQSIAALRDLVRAEQAGEAASAEIPEIVTAFAHRNGGSSTRRLVLTKQSAQMRLAPDQAFFSLRATQLSGTRRPGFVWHAHGTMLGLVPVEIVDAYAGGDGLLEARIAGSITVAKAAGPAMARGEAMRFLAELPFNPDGIFSPLLRWRQVDATTVDVAMTTADGEAQVQLGFDEAGDIISASAPDRPRMVGAESVPTAWIGRFSDYGPVGSYRLPRQGEVAWLLDDGEFVYWRGSMTDLTPITDDDGID